MSDLLRLLVVGAAVATASFTITKSLVFSPLRVFIMNRSEWLGDLFTCYYCLSHWIAAASVAVVPAMQLSPWWPVDILVSWLFIVATSTAVIRNLFPN